MISMIQFLVLDTILCIIVNTYVSSCLFINLIFIDSFIESINFVISRYKRQSNFFVFDYSLLARYINYFSISVTFYIIELLIWFKYDLKYFKIFASSPCLINFLILHLNFYKLEMVIRQKYRDSIINLLSKALSKTINFISKNSLNIDPKIRHFEIKPFVKQTDYLTMFFNFLNTFLVVSYLYYLKQLGYIYSTSLIKKYLLKFKKFKPNNIIAKKIYVSKILNSRSWEHVVKPQTLDIFLKIYMEGKDENKQILKFFIKYVNNFKKKLKNCLCSWTIAAFLKIPYLTNFISLLLIKTKYKSKDILPLILSYIFFFLIKSNNTFILSIIAEFLPTIIFSKIFIEIYKEIYKKMYEFLTHIYNLYNFNILSILFTSSISFIFFKHFTLSFIFGTFFVAILLKTKYIISVLPLSIIIISTSVFSHFSLNVYHIIIIPFITDFIYNVYKIDRILCKKEEERSKLLSSFYIKKDEDSILINNYIKTL